VRRPAAPLGPRACHASIANKLLCFFGGVRLGGRERVRRRGARDLHAQRLPNSLSEQRVYLARISTQTEQLTEFVDQRIQSVVAEQDSLDVRALSLVGQQLDPDGGSEAISQADLNEAVGGPSLPVRTQIFARAREQRRRTPRNLAAIERTKPVFTAPIAADRDGRYHRNHAQLAYTLRDRGGLPAATDEMSKAIQIRDDVGDPGYRIYEFVRARRLTRSESEAAGPSSSDIKSAYHRRPKAAARSNAVRVAVAATATSSPGWSAAQ
jgi:hypothetical protein